MATAACSQITPIGMVVREEDMPFDRITWRSWVTPPDRLHDGEQARRERLMYDRAMFKDRLASSAITYMWREIYEDPRDPPPPKAEY